MATINQLNLPAIFAAAQGVKRSQLENRLLQQKFTLGEEGQRRDEALRGLAPGVLAGDPDATTQAGTLDADLTAGLVDLRGKISDQQAEAQADRWEVLGRAAIRADTPEKWKREITAISKDNPDLAQFADQFDRRQEFIDTLKTATQLFREPTAVSPVNIRFADGSVQAFAPRDPALKDALAQEGAIRIGVQDTLEGATRPPSANRQDEIRGNIQAVSRARSTLAKVRESIIEDRSRSGVAGSVKRFIQEGVGIVGDFADLGIDVPDFISGILPQVSDDIKSGAADQGISGFFDASIPENDVFENSLAYALARARKGSGRLNRDDLINARRDTRITGLTSSDAVLSRLKAIEEELAAAEADFESRIEGETNTDDVIFEFNPSTGRLERVR